MDKIKTINFTDFPNLNLIKNLSCNQNSNNSSQSKFNFLKKKKLYRKMSMADFNKENINILHSLKIFSYSNNVTS